MIEILTGTISGAFSGIGMGGGTILILILSVFIGVEQHIAQATNLVFFVPTSITAIITTLKEKLINWKVRNSCFDFWSFWCNVRCKNIGKNGSL